MTILENAVLKLHNAMERATDHQDESVISVKLTQREWTADEWTTSAMVRDVPAVGGKADIVWT